MNLEDGRCVRYYMRIIQADGYGVEEKLEFVRNFNAATFSDGWPGEFGKNLEPKSDADNTTLSRVTINNTASQIGWAGLEVEQITEPVFTIREISEETASITVEYLVNYIRQGRETYASVEEVYRVRQGTDRMYLLDYERQMSEIFAEDNSAFVGDKIVLGITDPHVEMMESDGGKILAFAQAGVLYSVNVTDNRLSKLFSFYDSEGRDERTFYSGHDFKILQVDEAGNVFLWYTAISAGVAGKVIPARKSICTIIP